MFANFHEVTASGTQEYKSLNIPQGPKDLQSPRGQINYSGFKIQPQFLIPFPAKGKQATAKGKQAKNL